MPNLMNKQITFGTKCMQFTRFFDKYDLEKKVLWYPCIMGRCNIRSLPNFPGICILGIATTIRSLTISNYFLTLNLNCMNTVPIILLPNIHAPTLAYSGV